jgi:acyl-CoA thioesterase I
VARIATAAASAKVNVFHRFALMRQWESEGVSRDALDDGYPEHLHTSQWATDCIALALSEAIVNSPP